MVVRAQVAAFDSGSSSPSDCGRIDGSDSYRYDAGSALASQICVMVSIPRKFRFFGMLEM